MQPRFETIVNPNVVRAMNNLEASFNLEALKVVAEAKSENKSLPMTESNTMEFIVVTELVEPNAFQEAWNLPNSEL